MKYKDTRKLDDKFNPVEIEKRCVEFWDNNKTYKYDNTASRENTFVVDTPPPTISGSLHIGHIFSYTQTDAMVRWNRMQGKSIFYPIGWDDNGLPTERRVQNYYNISCDPKIPYDPNFEPVHLEKDENPRKAVSRQNFIEACELLIHEDEKIFEDIFKRVGHSYDWSLKYSTISPKSIEVSQGSFLDLVEKGCLESVEAPTMWDTTFGSAIAQAEVEDREMEGRFHDLEFKIEGSDKTFIISTTRPELLPACISIVAHPDDDRYKGLFGKNAIVPLFELAVPIVPSEHAEPDKGTGIMMVCTFGDAADVAWWKQSNQPIRQIIGLDGRIMDVNYGAGSFASLNPSKAKTNFDRLIGLTVKKAQTKIVELLKEDGALKGEPRPIMHPVKFYEKGSLPLEFVSSRQWFIKLLDKKDKMLDAGKKIKWYPEHMHHRYENWTEGLNQDWCISRQRYFGVPFPVWYKIDDKGIIDYNTPIFAKKEQLPVDPMIAVPEGFTEDQRSKPNGFAGDPDVMDTWATSSMTPQIALAHAPKGSPVSLPFDVRPQAHDIIRTWAFYTIAKAMLHENKLPWENIYISGFILDPDRKKMSKSKGNVITPIALVDKYSSDAVRYWATRAKLGIDTAYEEQIMEQGRKLVMKIFNASRFVLSIVEASQIDVSKDYKANITNPLDLSWVSKLVETIEHSTKGFEKCDYSQGLEAAEKCFWDFCDNYLEIVKGRAYNSEDKSAVSTLMLTLDTFLKLFAPFCPFITEEVFQCRPWAKENTSVHTEIWPTSPRHCEEFATKQSHINPALYDALVVISSEIRKTKTDAKTTLKTPVSKLEILAPKALIESLKTAQTDIDNVGRINENATVYKEAEELGLGEIKLDLVP